MRLVRDTPYRGDGEMFSWEHAEIANYENSAVARFNAYVDHTLPPWPRHSCFEVKITTDDMVALLKSFPSLNKQETNMVDCKFSSIAINLPSGSTCTDNATSPEWTKYNFADLIDKLSGDYNWTSLVITIVRRPE